MSQAAFISTNAALECEWVLRYAYKFSPPEIVAVLRRLFGNENVLVAQHDRE